MKKKTGILPLLTALCQVLAGVSTQSCSKGLDGQGPWELTDTKQLGTNIYLYSRDHDGDLPPSLVALKEAGYWVPNPDRLRQFNYFYTGEKGMEISLEAPIVTVQVPEGVYVYFWGGNARFLRKDEFNSILEKLKK